MTDRAFRVLKFVKAFINSIGIVARNFKKLSLLESLEGSQQMCKVR